MSPTAQFQQLFFPLPTSLSALQLIPQRLLVKPLCLWSPHTNKAPLPAGLSPSVHGEMVTRRCWTQTRQGDKGRRGHKGHLYPHKPPAAELGTVLGTSCLSAPIMLAPVEQLFEGSSFSLMSSTLTNITITAESEGKVRRIRRRIKQTNFSWPLLFFYFDPLLCVMSSLRCYLLQSQV